MDKLIIESVDASDDAAVYEIRRPDGGWKRVFTPEDIEKLRPIAETIALMDGNGFEEAWQHYLPGADAVYRNNGGDTGWAGNCSWIKKTQAIKSDPTCRDLWDKLQILLAIKEKL